MNPLFHRTAQRNLACRVSIQRVLTALCLLVALVGTPVRPASARPVQHPRLSLGSPISLPASARVSDGALAWGDFDNNGSLDLLATGMLSTGSQVTSKTAIFTYQNNAFVENPVSSVFQQVQSSSAAWGDYDNDGYLDLLLTGQVSVDNNGNVIGFTAIYHNVPSGSGRTFVLTQQLPNIYQGSGTWGDYNNDGRLDILLTGNTDGGAPFARIYKNNGNSSGTIFDATSIPVTPVGFSASAWADIDKDGYPDFVLSGKAVGDIPVAQVYHNNGDGTFTVTDLPGLWEGTVNFLDYDLDGYLDLLVTGNSGTDISPNIRPTTTLYQNTVTKGPLFTAVASTGLPGVWNSSVSIGDYNNDGFADLAITGKTLTSSTSAIFTNNRNGTFTDAGAGLPSGASSVLAWGDFNRDNTLDLAFTGVGVGYGYPNSPPAGNSAPTAPIMRSACWTGPTTDQLILQWDPASDPSAPAVSLSYNARVWNPQNNQDVLSPAADPATGFRRLAEMGNAFNGLSTILKGLPHRNYNWSVQAVDTSYTGGPFDVNRVINLGTPVAVNDTFNGVLDNQPVQLDVLRNDSAGGDQLSILSFTQPAHGTIALAQDPHFLVYTPRAPYEGTDVFTYFAVRGASLYCSQGTVTINVKQFNDPPSDILLTPSSVPDKLPAGSTVGRLSTIDPDLNETYTYSFVNGEGDQDNASFTIAGNQLQNNAKIDFATKNSYAIRIRTTDQGGLFFEKEFIITVVQEDAPSDITLDPSSVLEHQPVGSENSRVGRLKTMYPNNPNPSTQFIYTLVPSCAGKNYDTSSFNIISGGTYLWAKVVLDYKTKNEYQICIRSTDPLGLSVEKVFTIAVLPTIPSLFWLDSNGIPHSSTEPLPAIQMSEDGFDGKGNPDPFKLGIYATDLGIGETLTWAISQQPQHGTAICSGTTAYGAIKDVLYTPNKDWNGTDTFAVRIIDSGGNATNMPVTVNVNPVNDPPFFDPIKDIGNIPQLSGNYTVTITGISPGPPNESGQTVTLSAYGYCTYNTCPVSAVKNGTAVLTFPAGVGPGTVSILVRAFDGQQYKNNFSLAFKVTFLDGPTVFLPMVKK